MVDAYKGAETFHEVWFETALVDTSVWVLDPSLSVTTVLVKITLVDWAILVDGSSSAVEEAGRPYTR